MTRRRPKPQLSHQRDIFQLLVSSSCSDITAPDSATFMALVVEVGTTAKTSLPNLCEGPYNTNTQRLTTILQSHNCLQQCCWQ